jgi:chromate reductase
VSDSAPIALLLVCGSVRQGSTNAALLNTIADLAPDDVIVVRYDALEQLPHFNPDLDGDSLPPAAAALRATIGASDAVLFSTPEYAGALPGSFKNLLDWSVGGGEIYEMPVGWLNASAGPTGGADAHNSLRIVLRYLSCQIVEDACIKVDVPRKVVSDGLVQSDQVRDQLSGALKALAEAAVTNRKRPS